MGRSFSALKRVGWGGRQTASQSLSFPTAIRMKQNPRDVTENPKNFRDGTVVATGTSFSKVMHLAAQTLRAGELRGPPVQVGELRREEEVLWPGSFANVAELVEALREFRQWSHDRWLIERHGYRTSCQARAGFWGRSKGLDTDPKCRRVG